MERKNFRLSKKVKEQTMNLLQSGIPTGVVLDKYMCPTEENAKSKPMTPADIHNIRRKSNVQGSCSFMTDHFIHEYSQT